MPLTQLRSSRGWRGGHEPTGYDFTTADQTVRAEGVQRIKTWIEVAAKLGAPTFSQ